MANTITNQLSIFQKDENNAIYVNTENNEFKYDRGLGSIDLQQTLSEYDTSSGNHSTISGGAENRANGLYVTIAGGYQNSSNSSNTVVSGGYSNTACGPYSTVSGGKNNEVSNECSVVSGGFNNNANGRYSSISGGYNSEAGGYYSAVLGGKSHESNGDYSAVLGGHYNHTIGHYSTTIGSFNTIMHDNVISMSTKGEEDNQTYVTSTRKSYLNMHLDNGKTLNNCYHTFANTQQNVTLDCNNMPVTFLDTHIENSTYELLIIEYNVIFKPHSESDCDDAFYFSSGSIYHNKKPAYTKYIEKTELSSIIDVELNTSNTNIELELSNHGDKNLSGSFTYSVRITTH